MAAKVYIMGCTVDGLAFQTAQEGLQHYNGKKHRLKMTRFLKTISNEKVAIHIKGKCPVPIVKAKRFVSSRRTFSVAPCQHSETFSSCWPICYWGQFNKTLHATVLKHKSKYQRYSVFRSPSYVHASFVMIVNLKYVPDASHVPVISILNYFATLGSIQTVHVEHGIGLNDTYFHSVIIFYDSE